MAYRNGVNVEEYAIGFPPTLWSKRLKSGIKFKLNSVPLGGYVKLQGEYDAANQAGDYGKSSYWVKTKILFAGVAMNFILACMILTVLSVTGMPKVLSNQFSLAGDKIVMTPVIIDSLEIAGPASKVGLRAGDEVVAVNKVKIKTPEQLRQMTKSLAGQAVDFTIKRTNQVQLYTIELRDSSKPANQGYSGIYPNQTTKTYTKWYKSPVVGTATALQFGYETLKGTGALIANFFGGLVQKVSFDPNVRKVGDQNLAKAGDSVTGPIGILGVIFPALISTDATTFFFFVAMISITLAVMNTLPIPALDGGRWFTATLFRVLRRPLTEETETKIQVTGMIVLLTLTAMVVVSDIFKFF